MNLHTLRTAALLLLGVSLPAAAQRQPPTSYSDRWTDGDTAYLYRVLDATASDIVDGATPSEWASRDAALARHGLTPLDYGALVGFLVEVREDALREEKEPGTIRRRAGPARWSAGEIQRMLDNIAWFRRNRAGLTRRMIGIYLLLPDGTAPGDP